MIRYGITDSCGRPVDGGFETIEEAYAHKQDATDDIVMTENYRPLGIVPLDPKLSTRALELAKASARSDEPFSAILARARRIEESFKDPAVWGTEESM